MIQSQFSATSEFFYPEFCAAACQNSIAIINLRQFPESQYQSVVYRPVDQYHLRADIRNAESQEIHIQTCIFARPMSFVGTLKFKKL